MHSPTAGMKSQEDARASSASVLLEPLLGLTREILTSEDHGLALQRIGQTILDSFGFGLVSIVAADEPNGDLRRIALLGFDENVSRRRIGETINRGEVESVLRADPEFEVLENCFYVPMERDLKPKSIVENVRAQGRDLPRPFPEAWHPRDSLTIVLTDSAGAIVAYITADDPRDGKIPSVERMHELQLFMNLAGLSLANAKAIREQKARIAAQSEALEMTRKLLLESKNAITDPLTNIANRRAFDEALKAEWSRSSRTTVPVALILIDIDHFKAYNDTYGHVAGDACLIIVANAIAEAAKRPEDLVARYGGEEFAVILPGTDHDSALEIAQAICTGIFARQIPHASASNGYVSVSAGVACSAPDITRPSALVEAADIALYSAKRLGRNLAQ